MPAWLSMVLGITLPVLLGHATVATAFLFRVRHAVFGSNGSDGLMRRLAALETLLRGDPGELSLEQRARHGAVNQLSPQYTALVARLSDLEIQCARQQGAEQIAELVTRAMADLLKQERHR